MLEGILRGICEKELGRIIAEFSGKIPEEILKNTRTFAEGILGSIQIPGEISEVFL